MGGMHAKLDGMPQKLATADTFVGKRVVDREGTNFGRVKHIHINRDTLAVSGATVHHGFRKDYFIPETFIERFTDETLLLSAPPVRRAVRVDDIDGHRVGKVKRLNRTSDTNELESITVSHGLFGSKVVSVSEIHGIGERIILRIKKREFEKLA